MNISTIKLSPASDFTNLVCFECVDNAFYTLLCHLYILYYSTTHLQHVASITAVLSDNVYPYQISDPKLHLTESD